MLGFTRGTLKHIYQSSKNEILTLLLIYREKCGQYIISEMTLLFEVQIEPYKNMHSLIRS